MVLRAVIALLAVLSFAPSQAEAQWYVAGFMGANAARPATVTIDQPSVGTRLELAGVEWTSESFKSPQYYGYRVGRLFGGPGRRWGIEFEFVHPKMFAKTSSIVAIRGTVNGVPFDGSAPMDTFVSRYAMSHGINFALANFVVHQPLGGGDAPRLALTVRGGAGPTIPHNETTVGESIDRYEMGGIGFQGAAGVDIRVHRWLSATAEYKLAWARPEIDIARDGTGKTTAAIHQFAAGIAIGVRR